MKAGAAAAKTFRFMLTNLFVLYISVVFDMISSNIFLFLHAFFYNCLCQYFGGVQKIISINQQRELRAAKNHFFSALRFEIFGYFLQALLVISTLISCKNIHNNSSDSFLLCYTWSY